MCKILGLFVNGLTADDKCSFVNKGNLMESIHMHLSKKQKNIFWIFFCAFLKFKSNFEHFEKKNDPHTLCILEITDCKRGAWTSLLKNPVSEDPSTSDMVNCPKHYGNLKASTITIFINHSEENCVGKSLS